MPRAGAACVRAAGGRSRLPVGLILAGAIVAGALPPSPAGGEARPGAPVVFDLRGAQRVQATPAIAPGPRGFGVVWLTGGERGVDAVWFAALDEGGGVSAAPRVVLRPEPAWAIVSAPRLLWTADGWRLVLCLKAGAEGPGRVLLGKLPARGELREVASHEVDVTYGDLECRDAWADGESVVVGYAIEYEVGTCEGGVVALSEAGARVLGRPPFDCFPWWAGAGGHSLVAGREVWLVGPGESRTRVRLPDEARARGAGARGRGLVLLYEAPAGGGSSYFALPVTAAGGTAERVPLGRAPGMAGGAPPAAFATVEGASAIAFAVPAGLQLSVAGSGGAASHFLAGRGDGHAGLAIGPRAVAAAWRSSTFGPGAAIYLRVGVVPRP